MPRGSHFALALALAAAGACCAFRPPPSPLTRAPGRARGSIGMSPLGTARREPARRLELAPAALRARCAVRGADAELREFVAASLHIEPLSASSGAACLAVAGLRCEAFSGACALSADVKIARRFEALGVVRERLKKGATCLVASIEGPFPAGVLSRLEGYHELQVAADREAFRRLELLSSAGDRPADVAGSDAADALESWQMSTQGRRIILGAIDVSTHEFDLSPRWKEAYGGDSTYLSDMAVELVSGVCSRLQHVCIKLRARENSPDTQAFRRLGVGALLFAAALDLAHSKRCGDVFLHVEERNAAAIALYRAQGFEVVADSEGVRTWASGSDTGREDGE